ncbi:MAG: HEAT repeat domain-containing protein, partial [Candidatus Ratteibacteria bacterium]
DPKVRIQAIQSLTGAMVSSEGTTGRGDNTSGIRGLFGIDVNQGTGNNDTTGGVGGAIFIPDLFVLLNDPDPEVQDMASMGLDILFGTDVTILRFMDDPDPIVRQYATKIYSTRSFSGDTTRTTRQNRDEYEEGSLKELVALRTLLVRLKYEKDEGVRKVLTDSIELYLQSIGLGREGQGGTRGTSLTGIFGVDPSIIKYLNDDNVEVRKNAVKIISAMEYNPQILNILLERLKKETDDGVKEEIQKAIDSYARQRSRFLETQGVPTR